MRLEAVIGIVERDRALESLRARHPLLRHAAMLHLEASHSFYPSPAAHSLSAFDLFVLKGLTTQGRAATERECLALLLRMLQAAAFEHLNTLGRQRQASRSAPAPRQSHDRQRRGLPAREAVEQALLNVAAAFEHAQIAFDHAVQLDDALWDEIAGLAGRVEQLQRLSRQIASSLRSAARQARRARLRRLRTVLLAVMVTAAAFAVLGTVLGSLR